MDRQGRCRSRFLSGEHLESFIDAAFIARLHDDKLHADGAGPGLQVGNWLSWIGLVGLTRIPITSALGTNSRSRSICLVAITEKAG